MQLQPKGRYKTKFGNEVYCEGPGHMDGTFVCRYVDVIEGHDVLRGKHDVWTEDGQWVKNPGQNHDIVEEA